MLGTAKWKAQVRETARTDRWPNDAKQFVVMLGIGEGGRGQTWNSENLWNFWSLKYREGIGAGQVIAPDGYPTCLMRSADHALAVLLAFFRRKGGAYYPRFDELLDRPVELSHHVLPVFNSQGMLDPWKKLHHGLNYVQYIMQFWNEAGEALRECGWMPSTPDATPAPTSLQPAVSDICDEEVEEPEVVPVSELRIERVAGIGDRMLGTIWRPVRNFDRISIRPANIFVHNPAALGVGVMDTFDNPLTLGSYHFYILPDGTRYQLVPLNYRAWGAGGWNPVSLHVCLANLGWFWEGHKRINAWHDQKARTFTRVFWPNIRQTVSQDEFSWLQDPRSGSWAWYHNYPDAQINSLCALLRPLLSYCPGGKPRVRGHDEVDRNRGDPGPGFPWEVIRASLA